ncbi:Ferric-chelate reductase 1 [Oopsacas minuta]|uniref:Ferric-chelate reductase 1 n=1 Tax=Oopsacas minuta TaxID=111878 RepID=A0AAV7JYP5_9METZ|nr:Ferric-chelate reductase 1 [Oopsacas minuta]
MFKILISILLLNCLGIIQANLPIGEGCGTIATCIQFSNCAQTTDPTTPNIGTIYTIDDTTVQFQLQYDNAAADWIAMGLSTTQSMPNSFIFMCVRSGVDVVVQERFASARARPPEVTSDLTLINSINDASIINCTFNTNVLGSPNLNRGEGYYVLLAWGTVSGGLIQQHGGASRCVSSSEIVITTATGMDPTTPPATTPSATTPPTTTTLPATTPSATIPPTTTTLPATTPPATTPSATTPPTTTTLPATTPSATIPPTTTTLPATTPPATTPSATTPPTTTTLPATTPSATIPPTTTTLPATTPPATTHQLLPHQLPPPYQLPPHQLLSHQLPPPYQLLPHQLPPHQLLPHQLPPPYQLPPHQLLSHQLPPPYQLPPHQLLPHQLPPPYQLPPHQLLSHQLPPPYQLLPHQLPPHQLPNRLIFSSVKDVILLLHAFSFRIVLKPPIQLPLISVPSIQ